MMPANELAAVIVKALDAKKGENIQLLKTQDLTTLADYFVICTASSSTHVKTLTDAVEAAADDVGEPVLRREGHQRQLGPARLWLRDRARVPGRGPQVLRSGAALERRGGRGHFRYARLSAKTKPTGADACSAP